MSLHTAPSYSATVSPELVALLVGNPSPSRVAGMEPDISSPVSVEPAEANTMTASGGSAWETVRLRRDGTYPLRIDALALAERETVCSVVCGEKTYPVIQRVRLFVTSSSAVAVQVIFLPPDDSPARPVYRAWLATSAEDCAAHLNRTSAAQCFTVSMQPTRVHSGHLGLPVTPNAHSKLLN